MASILGRFTVSSSGGSCFVRTICYYQPILGGPSQHGSQLYLVIQPLHHNKAVLWSSSGPYVWESWIIKKIECQIIDPFELPCWRRLLKVSWTARRLNESILRGINPENSLEGLMLKLKPQYFGHLMQTDDKPSKHVQKQRHYLANKGPSSQSCFLSSSHIWI